jgi:hypothetical protein
MTIMTQDEGTFLSHAPPSAVLSDGVMTVPLYAVTAMTLSENYHLPPIGMSGVRALVASHDDTVSLTGALLGTDRFTWKFLLERMAESSKRGTLLEIASRGLVSGLVLVTAMTVRTDMQVQSLSFSATANRRGVIDVSMSLVHVPPPGVTSAVLDAANLAVRGLGDFASVTGSAIDPSFARELFALGIKL